MTVGQQFLEAARNLKDGEGAEQSEQGSEADMERLRSVRRSQIKVEHSKKTWSEVEAVPEECKVAWLGFMKKYEKQSSYFSSLVTKLQNTATTALRSACSACEAVAGGKKNGGKWTDGLKGNLKWPALALKFKDGLLFDIQAKDLATAMASLVEAC